jgi:UDP-N-acetylmuramate dehydrogenase
MFQNNISLKSLNTFGINAIAEKFAEVDSVEQLLKIISKHKDFFILSGGSNILLTQNISKPVIHLVNKGIEFADDQNDSNAVIVKAQAGENWHELVLWCISKNFGGLENLSLIPGNVGTSPMQNIGAYGVEIKDVFHELQALEISSGKIISFQSSDCSFGYRESVFKNVLKGQFIILNVSFRLSKINHKINASYGAIQSELELNNITSPTIKDISNAVIAIRKSKLPDPDKIGNSGSFFKNPVISKAHFSLLQKEYPAIPNYIISDDLIKVPAGWLVEQCGFKGKRYGDAGVHKHQALVLVNYDNAKGLEILKLAKEIQEKVSQQFNIILEMEVNIM